MSLAQLSQLLPLPENELGPLLDYATTLSKDEAAAHLTGLLGDSPAAIDFISAFNSRRASPPASSRTAKAAPPSLRPASGHAGGAGGSLAESRSLSPSPARGPATTKGKAKKQNKVKVSIAGGAAMSGHSSTLADLDAAIRALELTTNPGLESDRGRGCNCVAALHPLQGAAPNCLSCGKVVCAKEGLGPCTFCHSPLLSPDQVQAMLRELKEERGRERMAANAELYRRRGGGNQAGSLAGAAAAAREHRDKLLSFQAQNARRTTVRDEAADFDLSGAMAGTGSIWASPEERARELKRQQRLLREAEWNARPDYEKRTQAISIDTKGKGKVVHQTLTIRRPAQPRQGAEVDRGRRIDEEEEEEEEEEEKEEEETAAGQGGDDLSGSKSRSRGQQGHVRSDNPLRKRLTKPVFKPAAHLQGDGRSRPRVKETGWRRVQDRLADEAGESG